ncbi:MAG: HlyC/CorC family transporter [Alphaproteobacteria bacterium]|nr:MAG: HlyC/CorC family transporter [Alphaproteobacteria bacterium]
MAEANIIFELVLVCFLFCCSMFFSSSETGLTVVSRARMYQMHLEGNRRARKVMRLHEKRDAVITTILIGNNIVNIGATAISTSLAIAFFGDHGVAFATAALTVIVIIFCEILPKTIAFYYAEQVSLFVSTPMMWLVKVFLPITKSVQWFIARFMRLFGIDFSLSSSIVSASELIRGTIEMHHKEGDMIKQERDMLGSILDLSSVEVCDVMTHRKKMESVNIALSPPEIIKAVLASNHSRLPFWRNEPENIIGVLHVRDLMRLVMAKNKHPSQEEIEALLSAPLFVPETTSISQQLYDFRTKKRHFAVVVNEYGVCQGIITLEDILEEIVGDINDEHDVAASVGVKRIGEQFYKIDGTTTIRDVNRLLDWNLPDEKATTIAGLVIHESRSIPEVGASFQFYGYQFTVDEKRSNQIVRLSVQRLHQQDDK